MASGINRSRSFLGGLVFAFLYQGGAMLVGLWLTPFYLRTLGPHDYGVWLVGLQILTFLLLADLGIIAVTPRDVARANGLEQREAYAGDLQRLAGETLKVVLCQTVLIAVLALGTFLLWRGIQPELRGPLGLILAVFVVTYPLRLWGAILQGLQDLKFMGQVRIWLWALSVAVTVVLLYWGARFYALALGWCLQEIGANVVTYFRLRSIRPDLSVRVVWNQAGPLKWRWFTRGLWVSLSQLALTLLAGADVLIVARAFGPATVVIYSCTAKLVTVLQNQPQLIAGIALPGLSHMKASESRENILRATTSLKQAMLLVAGAVFCVVLATNRQFVSAWVGPAYFGGSTLTLVLLLNFIARVVDYTLAIALFAFGYEKQSTIRCLMDGVVSVSTAVILAQFLGLVGIALGFLVGVVCVAIPIDLYFFARELKVSIIDVIRPYAPYVWRFSIVGLVAALIVGRTGITEIWFVIVVACLVGLAYLTLVIPYVIRTPLAGYFQAAIANVRTAREPRAAG